MSKLDTALINKAVTALLKFEEKKSSSDQTKKQLLSGYAKPVLVQIQLVSAIKQAVLKPVQVKIPNSLFSPEEEDHTICLFCRSKDKAEIDALLEQFPIDGLSKVLTVDQVKRQYALFKDKKRLLKEHTHFLVDSRVTQHITNLLGTTFSTGDNRPLPINLNKIIVADTKKSPSVIASIFKNEVSKAVNSAHFKKSGSTLSIRIGHTSMNASDVAENILVGVPGAVQKLTNAWRDVHSMHIKTSDSAALPVYSQDINEMAQYVAQKATGSTPTKSVKTDTKTKASKGPTTKLSKPVASSVAASISPASAASPVSKKKEVASKEKKSAASKVPEKKETKSLGGKVPGKTARRPLLRSAK